jgi:nucleotide-binding universal stress UspA family protein
VTKHQVKKILVPMDGSKNSFRGLDTAIYLARQCGATITGLYVMPIRLSAFSPITIERKYLLKSTNEFMSKAKERSAQNGIVFHGKTTTGDSATEILNFSQKNKFDIILIGARGLGSVKEIFLGSVSHAVVHKSKIPVLVVK